MFGKHFFHLNESQQDDAIEGYRKYMRSRCEKHVQTNINLTQFNKLSTAAVKSIIWIHV